MHAMPNHGFAQGCRAAVTRSNCARGGGVFLAGLAGQPDPQPHRRCRMKRWSKPRMVEICTGMEINSYASAE